MKEFILIKEMEEYEINDIVTYKNKEKDFVTHRIIEKQGENFITRGDNNTINDEPIKLQDIEGKVILHSIVLGEIILYWLKPSIIIVFICLILNFIKYGLLSRKAKVIDEKSS